VLRSPIVIVVLALLPSVGCNNQTAKEVPRNPRKEGPARHEAFYRQLFAPLEKLIGPIDRNSLVAIVGFDAGGPLNFCTKGNARGERFVTYVSCELAVRPEKKPNESGRYELLVSCDDEKWVRSIISGVGRMSLEEPFGHHHTLDIGPVVGPEEPVQGLVFEKMCDAVIEGEHFGVLRCIGITRAEMEYALSHGAPELIAKLKQAGIYPHTATHRRSVL
jgi:hypothetical protein